MNNDIAEALTPVADALDGLQIPFCIGGSVASSHYGILRRTNDIDIVAALTESMVMPLADWLREQFYLDEQSMLSAVRQKGSFNLIHFASGMKVDCFIPKDTPFSRQQLQHVVQVELFPGIRSFPMASAEDTVIAKLDWYRKSGKSARQWEDIKQVLTRQTTLLDFGYMRQMAAQMGVADVLEEAIKQL